MYHFTGSFLSDSRSNPIRSDPIEFNAKQTLCFIHMFSILRVRVIEIAIENIDNILCKQCIKSHEKKNCLKILSSEAGNELFVCFERQSSFLL